MSAWLFLWHAVHHGSLSNVPPGRLQTYGFKISRASRIGQRLPSESEDVQGMKNQTDSDMRLGWFQHKGLAALMPKPTCRVWRGISLPNSFPLTWSSTSVPSGNGDEENKTPISATAHVEDAGTMDTRTIGPWDSENGTVGHWRSAYWDNGTV